MALQKITPQQLTIFFTPTLQRKRAGLCPYIDSSNRCYQRELLVESEGREFALSMLCGLNPKSDSLDTVVLKRGSTEAVVSMDQKGEPICALIKYCHNDYDPSLILAPDQIMFISAKIKDKKPVDIEYLHCHDMATNTSSWLPISQMPTSATRQETPSFIRSLLTLYIETASAASKETLPEITQMERAVN